MAKKHFVIIGNSAAGINALETFRERDRDSEVTIVDAEDRPAYSRVLTTYYLAGAITEEGLYMRDEAYYRENEAKTLFGRRAVELDTEKQHVVLDDGKKLPYDSLLIATGASAVVPDLEGFGNPGVFTLRSIEDARGIMDWVKSGGEVVILGAGLVSMEVLNALYDHGRRFTLIVSSEQILSRLLDKESAAMVDEVVQERGVRVLNGRNVKRITPRKGKGGKLTVTLDSGDEIPADMVFIGKGVKPNIDFLSGSPVNCERGVLVDARMETSVKGVFAAGDVAQAQDRIAGESRIHGIWPEAIDEGRIAGVNMAGGELKHTGALRLNVTHILDQVIAVAGEVDSPMIEKTIVFRNPKRRIYRKIAFDSKGRILGAILLNRCIDIGIIQALIRTGRCADYLKQSIGTSPVHYGRIAVRNLF